MAFALVAACGGKRSLMQGKVKGEHFACNPTAVHGRFDCAAPLRDFLRAHRDARIAGVNVIYGEGRDDVLVWLAENDAWPKASTLAVDDHECTRRSDDVDPPCAREIDDLTRAQPAKHHYFLVPVYGTPDPPASPGSWSVLDVHSSSPGTSGDAGWDTVKTQVVRCRLDPGEHYLADYGSGVMRAVRVDDDDGASDGSERPGLCAPALVNYLRAHPDEHIAGVIALDGILTVRVGRHERPDAPGTVALIILLGPSAWPPARTLSTDDIACIDAMCATHFIEARPGALPRLSPRTLLTVPIGQALHEQARVDKLLMIAGG
jgi:hypothetical protein